MDTGVGSGILIGQATFPIIPLLKLFQHTFVTNCTKTFTKKNGYDNKQRYGLWPGCEGQNGAVTRMWRSCGDQPSHKERAIGAVRCKKEGMLLQPLRWCCVDCVIHHERDVREDQHHTYMWREQGIIEWSWHVNSVVACCHSAKLCARDFRSQHHLN